MALAVRALFFALRVMMKATGRLVLIEWDDSYGCSTDWEETPGDCVPVVCRSAGWLWLGGDGDATLVPHVAFIDGAEDQGCGRMVIPHGCIRRIVDLTEETEK